MAVSMAGGDVLPHPSSLLHHPGILTHREYPTPVDPVVLSPTLARSMEVTRRC